MKCPAALIEPDLPFINEMMVTHATFGGIYITNPGHLISK